MSDRIPKAVLTEALRERIKRRRVLAAVFCTFRLEPGFFEQEILPVLFDLPLHQSAGIRRLQLENALRDLAGQVAVYYDLRGLAVGDGTAALDVRRVAVSPSAGYFHPKNAFVLVVDDATGERALVVLTASANLTRAGWWENVECFHIEEIAEHGRSRTAPEMQRFVSHLRRLARHFGPQDALERVADFLTTVQPIVHRQADNVLHPHFIVTGVPQARPLVDQLKTIAGEWLGGADLEIISPYLDDADASGPLADLLDSFRPARWRILLPEERGTARCREALYHWVHARGGQWGRLPTAHTSRGSRQSGGATVPPRTVHAKVYRFLGPDWEITLVGSFNLTRPAHQGGGNVETGVLAELPGRRRPHFWLDPVEEPPAFPEMPATEDEDTAPDVVPLLVRYDWGTGEAEVLWDGTTVSPPLQAHHGVPLFDIPPLPPAVWTPLPPAHAETLSQRLRSSSFLTIVDGDRRGVVLIHETGMAHRPSQLLDLSPAEILKYWSMLDADQRAAYLAARGEDVESLAGGDAPRQPVSSTTESIFDRFAGTFHGFACLGRAVREALTEGRTEQARFLVFGAKHDSLPVLLQRMVNDASGDLVDRYVMVLCAQQLADQVRRGWPTFWASDPRGAERLEAALTVRTDLRAQITARNDATMTDFLDWYEPHFLGEQAEAPA
ncbi:hypothetical protein [Micromonospora haikouensis]|uniref:hypothetical protein n=1 Tax=Micromonospora haikouensis TaxID=686309 RepID=UPI0037A6AE87